MVGCTQLDHGENPTKNGWFWGVKWGYHHLRKHPNGSVFIAILVYLRSPVMKFTTIFNTCWPFFCYGPKFHVLKVQWKTKKTDSDEDHMGFNIHHFVVHPEIFKGSDCGLKVNRMWFWTARTAPPKAPLLEETLGGWRGWKFFLDGFVESWRKKENSILYYFLW